MINITPKYEEFSVAFGLELPPEESRSKNLYKFIFCVISTN